MTRASPPSRVRERDAQAAEEPEEEERPERKEEGAELNRSRVVAEVGERLSRRSVEARLVADNRHADDARRPEADGDDPVERSDPLQECPVHRDQG